MSLDIPDRVRKTVIADGNESWLDELPGVVDSLAQDWSLMIGSSFAGSHAALVVEVTLADGTSAVLKIGVPGRDVGQEAMDRRRLAHDDRSAFLVHGDIHEMNALQASDGSYKLIDPAGLRAEPACDLLLAEADRLTA